MNFNGKIYDASDGNKQKTTAAATLITAIYHTQVEMSYIFNRITTTNFQPLFIFVEERSR